MAARVASYALPKSAIMVSRGDAGKERPCQTNKRREDFLKKGNPISYSGSNVKSTNFILNGNAIVTPLPSPGMTQIVTDGYYEITLDAGSLTITR